MTQPKLRQKLRYRFDNTMSRGTPAMIGWLAFVSFALVVTLSSLVALADAEKNSMRHEMTQIWSTVVDTFKLGNADEGSLIYRVLVIALALTGLFFASTLIGLLTSGVSQKIADLRKGRSVVLEKNHTVVLGWSDQIFTIIDEMIQANASKRRACVAILADRDRAEMEDEINDAIGKTGTTRVVCRTGNPASAHDLDIVSPQTARSIIVVSPAGDAADQEVIRTLLSVSNSPTRGKHPYHVVAAVRERANRPAAVLAGRGEATVVDSDDIAARLIAHTCRGSGLSVVFTELLGFAGDEIYMKPEPALAGRSYGDVLLAYPASSVIGLRRGEAIMLNPSVGTLIEQGDEIIAISEDDDTLVLGGSAATAAGQTLDMDAIVTAPQSAGSPDRILMIGWNRRAGTIIQELDAYAETGSVLHVVAEDPEIKRHVDGIMSRSGRLAVTFEIADTNDRGVLDLLDVALYDQVIVLSERLDDPQLADSRAMVTLLRLREIQERSGGQYAIVSEMTDDRNRQLAQVTQADDFIVSEKLISLLMTQLSENRHLALVFADLLRAGGTEICVRPAGQYVRTGRTVSYASVVLAAAGRGETAIGYRVQAKCAEPPAFGVKLNPGKQTAVTFAPGDRVIVLRNR